MAGRWRSQQRRKCWTDHAAYISTRTVTSLDVWPELEPFKKQLALFQSQPSIYAQLTQVKPLGKVLLSLLPQLQLNPEAQKLCVKTFVDVLFVENSKPLHQGLLSIISQVPKEWEDVLRQSFRACCIEYGPDGIKRRKFALVAVAASLVALSRPGILKEVTQDSLAYLVSACCCDVRGVLQLALDDGRPTPTAMDETQNGLSSIYYLLQQFPEDFLGRMETSSSCQSWGMVNSTADADKDRFGTVVSLLIDVLQTSVLSRDCVVASGVAFAAVAQLLTEKEDLGLLLGRMTFTSSFDLYPIRALCPDASLEKSEGRLETVVRSHRGETLWREMEKLSEFGRVCLFRGILTAVPRDVLNAILVHSTVEQLSNHEKSNGPLLTNCSDLSSKGNWKLWTLLYDGILPSLCTFCESSVDSHFKFHAVTALQICLQQIKTSLCDQTTQRVYSGFLHFAEVHNISCERYTLWSPEMITRILQLIWNNWEDPLTQTVKQVQLVFDLLVDVQLVYRREHAFGPLQDHTAALEVDTEDGFLQKIAADLLSAGRYRKGKYVPLASLVHRVGAKTLLALKPDLLFQTVLAFSDDDVCCAASSFLKSFLERLKEDCWTAQGITEGTRTTRRHWIPPLLSGLLSGDERLRNNLTTYAVPVALQNDDDSLLVCVDYILEGHRWVGGQDEGCLSLDELQGVSGLPLNLSVDQQAVLLVSMLKVGRSPALALIDGAIGHFLDPMEDHTSRYENGFQSDIILSTLLENTSHAVFRIKGQIIQVSLQLLLAALTHKDDGLRVDAAELICLNPKTASMPSALELCFLRIALPLNMRCSSTGFRMRWTSFMRKFFHHVRSAAERQLKLKKPGKVQRESLHREHREDECVITQVGIDELQEFMQWLSQLLLSSLYPSAPYERKSMAMELLYALTEVWNLSEHWSHVVSERLQFSPYHQSLLSPDSTLVVVGAIVDSWDKLRENAYRILSRYPTPLPGLDSEREVEQLLRWAKSLACSPRVRESDAGALALRLIFRKYVLELAWSVKVHPEPKVVRSTGSGSGTNSVDSKRVGRMMVRYFHSLNSWLELGIEEGDKDLLKACKQSFVHGVLLVLRYAVDEVDWTSDSVRSSFGDFRRVFEKLLSLLLRVTSLALWVVSADALILKSRLDESPSSLLSEDGDLSILETSTEDFGDDYDSDTEGLAPAEQIVMVGCWLSVKEVSLLLGTIARAVPLPGCSSSNPLEAHKENGGSEEFQPSETSVMLDGEQLEAIGSHFLQVLLSMKHNGAIDKTRTGFIALCDRLLRSNDSRLSRMPEEWLNQLVRHTGGKGQVVDDLLRRSAGIPPAFLALFLAEPDGAPKKILPMGMGWLLDVCKGKDLTMDGESLYDTGNSSSLKESTHRSFSRSALIHSKTVNGESKERIALKLRDEGVVPRVHAFNVLRVAFHDTNLATDTSGFCAEGLMTAVQAFASPHWEIRNAATLAFTSLVHRMMGFLNVFQRESARRAITGFEFFHRYPRLHSFLLQELKFATLQFQHRGADNASSGRRLTSSLHPSLAPVLIILSRLKPSFINGDVQEWLNPSAFMPYVSKGATQRNLRVRVLASRALPPLVPSSDLFEVVSQLARRLPSTPAADSSQANRSEFLEVTEVANGYLNDLRSAKLKIVSYNEVHGVILQICALVTSNCMNTPDRDVQLRIVFELFAVLKGCWWLGSLKYNSCSTIVGSFLDLLGGLLQLSEASQQSRGDIQCIGTELRQLLISLTHECLRQASCVSNPVNTAQVSLREKAVKLYFEAVLAQAQLQSFSEVGSLHHDLNGILEQTISDPCYEVRAAALKGLKRVCILTEMKSPVEVMFMPLLLYRLENEKHPQCLRQVLQLIFSCYTREGERLWGAEGTCQNWNRMGSVGYPKETPCGVSPEQSIWPFLMNIYSSSRQVKTREALVRCLGGSLQHVRSIFKKQTTAMSAEKLSVSVGECKSCLSSPSISNDEQWKYVNDIVSIWSALVIKHSRASEPVNFRRAVAEAVVASGLLEDLHWFGGALRTTQDAQQKESLEEYGKNLLSVWCSSIKLLEDEDLNLRQKLSQAVLTVIARSKMVTEIVPGQVEKVIQLSFDFLTSHLATWKHYCLVLADWVIGPDPIVKGRNTSRDLVRRLFDKEIDNHHEEEFFFIQLCCFHLQRISGVQMREQRSQHGSDCSVTSRTLLDENLQKWRMRLLNHARDCAGFSVESSGCIEWVGGVTNHQDTFRSLYRGLLGLLTLSGFSESLGITFSIDPQEGAVLAKGLTELTNSLRQLTLNPLVSNILVVVLRAYERQLGLDLGSEDLKESLGSVYVMNFEPLFLIR